MVRYWCVVVQAFAAWAVLEAIGWLMVSPGCAIGALGEWPLILFVAFVLLPRAVRRERRCRIEAFEREEWG